VPAKKPASKELPKVAKQVRVRDLAAGETAKKVQGAARPNDRELIP
jgi:hypothetical protein